MRGWPFSKPKTPGFGISRGYFLTILSSESVLPAIAEIANPGGTGGAAIGLAVPLGGQADKSALSAPMERGAYVVASKDRKTVLKMLVMSKEEAGYDPEQFARSAFALDESEELVARIRATWTIAQLTFETHDPAVYPALDFFLGIACRMATLGTGVVADSICERYLLPDDLLERHRLDVRIDVRDHVAVKFRIRPDGVHAYTLGMQKFALEEYEISSLQDQDQANATKFLLTLCQNALLGDLTQVGNRFGSPKALFEACDGGFDKALWEGVNVFELLPPTGILPGEALAAWVAETS